MDQEELVQIFQLHKKCGKIKFSEIVKAASGHDVIPIDATDKDEAELLGYLTSALNNFLRLATKSIQRYHGKRINEVGKNIENQIVEEIKKTPLEIEKLGSSGYPDFEIKHGGKVVYLELKTTGNIKKKTTQHRMFYFSSGRKIKHDARHLLIQIQMEEEADKYWKVQAWEMRDLSTLVVSLKTEFNTNFQGLGNTELLKSSGDIEPKPKKERRMVAEVLLPVEKGSAQEKID